MKALERLQTLFSGKLSAKVQKRYDEYKRSIT